MIRTARLVLRNWENRDREVFRRINADDRVMEFFPFRRTPEQADAVMDRMRAEISANGYGWTAAEIAETGECIGFVGLHDVEVEQLRRPGRVEIGWRLAPEFWGFGYVSEAAQAWLAYGFETLGLDEIVSLAVWNNERSTAVMRRIGMHRVPGGDFDHPEVPDSHAELKRHVFYRLTRQEWGRD